MQPTFKRFYYLTPHKMKAKQVQTMDVLAALINKVQDSRDKHLIKETLRFIDSSDDATFQNNIIATIEYKGYKEIAYYLGFIASSLFSFSMAPEQYKKIFLKS